MLKEMAQTTIEISQGKQSVRVELSMAEKNALREFLRLNLVECKAMIAAIERNLM